MIDERLSLASDDLERTANNDGVGVTLDDLFNLAIDRGKRAFQCQGAAFEFIPLSFGITRRTSFAIPACKTVGYGLLFARKNVEAEMTFCINCRPHRCSQIDIDDDCRCSTERAVADVTVAPVLLSPVPAVNTLMPAASCRIAAFNSSAVAVLGIKSSAAEFSLFGCAINHANRKRWERFRPFVWGNSVL